MKKRQNNSAASALQITLCVALVCSSAILFASSFRAAPQATSDGFYPPLPATAQSYHGFPTAPAGVPAPITVSLPTQGFDNSVPSSTVIIEPVTTTLIDSTTSGGTNLVGFQGDFTFDSAVITFDDPFV